MVGEDERNLAYVAMTRAKHHRVVLCQGNFGHSKKEWHVGIIYIVVVDNYAVRSIWHYPAWATRRQLHIQAKKKLSKKMRGERRRKEFAHVAMLRAKR